MHGSIDSSNNTHPARLLDALPEPGTGGFGAAMLRLAEMAAAQHRYEQAQQTAGDAPAWRGLSVLNVSHPDTAEHGCPAAARSAHAGGPVTREGDR